MGDEIEHHPDSEYTGRSIHGRPRGLSRLLQQGRLYAARTFYPQWFWTREQLDAANEWAETYRKALGVEEWQKGGDS